MTKYDNSKINGFLIYRKNIENIFDRLRNSSEKDLISILSFEPERKEIIISGIMVLLEIMSALKIEEFYVSDLGIQYGLLNNSPKEIQKYLRD